MVHVGLFLDHRGHATSKHWTVGEHVLGVGTMIGRCSQATFNWTKAFTCILSTGLTTVLLKTFTVRN